MASIEAAGGGMKDVDLEEGGNDADTHHDAHLGDEAYSRSEAEDSKTLHSYTASSGNGSASETRNNMDMRGLHGSARRPSGRMASAIAGIGDGDVEAGINTPGAGRRPPDGVLGDPMEGVGEDEKPYNYICNLNKVNLGGPGWFNDVFKISIEVDSDRTFLDTLTLSLVPRHTFKRHCKLFDTSQHITGSVTVQAPPEKRVWMAGVTVTFEEHLMTVDTDSGELVGALEAQVALGQFVADKVIFNFDLDLQLLEDHRNWPVRETYVGDLMAIRHRILVAAHRPWYTFNVYKELPIAMECLTYAPEEDAGQDNEEGGPNHVLIISDCNGRCEFDFGRDSFSLADTLEGVVRFTDMASPIVAAHVLLLKAEFMYGEASEVLIAEHTILGQKRHLPDAATERGMSDEERLRKQFMSPFIAHKDVRYVQSQEESCRMEEVMGDTEVFVKMTLDPLPLTPSYMSLTQSVASITDEAELVGVRYYIRLILQDDAQAAFWHTHEVFFHRTEPSLSSSLALEEDPDSGDEDVREGFSGEDLDGASIENAAAVDPEGAVTTSAMARVDGDGDGARPDPVPTSNGRKVAAPLPPPPADVR